MPSFSKASSLLSLAFGISAQVANGHRLPKGTEFKQLRVNAGQKKSKSKGGSGKSKGKGSSSGEGGSSGPVDPVSPGIIVDPANFLDGNEFIAPGPDDSRGPCPFINVMANHGFINRNGRNVPVFEIPALAPILFDFPKEMFTRPANQAIFDGQVEVQVNGDALLEIERLWDRPGEERDISQVFPNPGLMWTTEGLSRSPDGDFEPNNTEDFIDFRYTVDKKLLQQLLSLSEDGVTMTQDQHNQHLHHRLQESLADDEFFRLSEDDIAIAATQYVLPCIILGEDVEDFSVCPRASIEALWTDFRFPEGFAPRSVRFGDAFVQEHYQEAFSELMERNEEDVKEALKEERAKRKGALKLRGEGVKVSTM